MKKHDIPEHFDRAPKKFGPKNPLLADKYRDKKGKS